MAFVWRSTKRSISEGATSLVALLETATAVGIYWLLGSYLSWPWFAFASLIAAPVLLLRSSESSEDGVHQLRQYWSGKEWPHKWHPQTAADVVYLLFAATTLSALAPQEISNDLSSARSIVQALACGTAVFLIGAIGARVARVALQGPMYGHYYSGIIEDSPVITTFTIVAVACTVQYGANFEIALAAIAVSTVFSWAVSVLGTAPTVKALASQLPPAIEARVGRTELLATLSALAVCAIAIICSLAVAAFGADFVFTLSGYMRFLGTGAVLGTSLGVGYGLLVALELEFCSEERGAERRSAYLEAALESPRTAYFKGLPFIVATLFGVVNQSWALIIVAVSAGVGVTVGKMVAAHWFGIPLIAADALGILARAFYIRIRSTILNVAAGFRCMPQNWYENMFVVDLLHPPELLPGAQKVDCALSVAGVLARFRDSGAIHRALLGILLTVWYVPSLLYRWGLKTTAWLWWPLAIAVSESTNYLEGQEIRERAALMTSGALRILLLAPLITFAWLAGAAYSGAELALSMFPLEVTSTAKKLLILISPPPFGIRYFALLAACGSAAVFWWRAADLRATHGKVLESPNEFNSLSEEQKARFLVLARRADRSRLVLIAAVIAVGEVYAAYFAFAESPGLRSKIVSNWIASHL